MNVLDSARADLAAGRAWKARVRLEGALGSHPANQDVLRLLAETCFVLGDLPAAGRYWFLTDARGADVDTATEALHEHHPTPRAVFSALPLKAPLEQYPEVVQRRVARLLDAAEPKWLWTKKLERAGQKPPTYVAPSDSRWRGAVVTAGILFFAGTWIIGLIAVVRGLIRLLGELV